jgi:hypothetical protein
MELSSPMLNPSVPPQQIPPDELWFGPSPGEFDKTSLTMEGRTVGRSPVRRPGGGGCRRRLACASAGVGATPIEGRLCPCRTLDAWGGRAFERQGIVPLRLGGLGLGTHTQRSTTTLLRLR